MTYERAMNGGLEKRREVRVPVDFWVDVDRRGELYFQHAANLSTGGLYFSQTIPLPLGETVTLQFTLPTEAKAIQCRGEIVTAKDLGMGVQFTELSDESRRRIDAFVRTHAG